MKLIHLFFILYSINVYGQLSAFKGETNYNFWLNLPEDSILNSNPPILVFLHGRSLSGTDLDLVKKYGVIHEIEKGRKVPAIVIAPQVVKGAWDPDKILEVIQYVQQLYPSDTNRVYVCGMSLGGYGTMHFAGKYPEKVTAAVALCGGGSTKDACNLASIPLWIQHGSADKAVPVSESRNIAQAIKECDNGGEQLIYTEIKGANHGALERIFRTDEMYDWLLSKSKLN